MKRIIITLAIIIPLFFILIIVNYPINKNSRIIITNSNNEEIAYINNKHYSSRVNLNNLNERYIDFILCIEDKSFYKHNGFDFKRIISSFINNITTDSTMGASTITQQYIKNTYLNNEKSIIRKIKEIVLAIKIENEMTKDEILSEYLSALYFGNNVYGLDNASKYYFNKPIGELTITEMISLIALWNSPSIYSNDLNKWNQKMYKLALVLHKNNLINKNEYNNITNIKLNINKEPIPSNKLFFITEALNEFNTLSVSTGFNDLVVIKTEYKDIENISSSLDINHSLIAMNKEGYIVSIIGNKSYYESTYNVAINGNRDIGSTIKPLLYYEAIKCGFEDKTYDSSFYSFMYNDELISVQNNSGLYFGNIDIKEALAVSDNIYAMKTHLAIGMNTLVYHLKKYGIKCDAIPSLALGSVGMSLKKITDIYSQFFNNGIYTTSRFIKYVGTNRKHINLTPENNIINDKIICNKIKALLANTFTKNYQYSTGRSISNLLNVKCYGKTGSTDYDSYVIGFSDNYLIGTWSGDINNTPLENNAYKSLPKELFYKAINKLESFS